MKTAVHSGRFPMQEAVIPLCPTIWLWAGEETAFYGCVEGILYTEEIPVLR